MDTERVLYAAMSIERWDERYRAGAFTSGEPAAIVAEAAMLVPPGRALDLACGAGRNAIWLAERGWNVVAVDASREALRLVEHANVDTRLLDLETGAPLPFDDESFDLVCIVDFLHRPLFGEARRVLRRGGMFAGAIRTRNINPQYRLEPGELAARFDDWQVLVARFGERDEVLARRPV
jgi:SAM-dependent methyltransferase